MKRLRSLSMGWISSRYVNSLNTTLIRGIHVRHDCRACSYRWETAVVRPLLRYAQVESTRQGVKNDMQSPWFVLNCKIARLQRDRPPCTHIIRHILHRIKIFECVVIRNTNKLKTPDIRSPMSYHQHYCKTFLLSR